MKEAAEREQLEYIKADALTAFSIAKKRQELRNRAVTMHYVLSVVVRVESSAPKSLGDRYEGEEGILALLLIVS